MTLVHIADVDYRGRSRKHLGDLDALAESIERIGLLHPIVLTPDNKLIVGRRRLEAFRKLGRDTIPANVAKDLSSLAQLLEAERDENTCREAYTPEEAVELGKRFEKVAKELAKKAQEEGQKKGGGDRKSEKAKRSRKTLPKAKQDETKRAAAQQAATVGMSRPTFEKAKAVVESGDRALIDEMNRTGKVDRAYKALARERAITAPQAPLPEDKFNLILADPPWKYDFAETDNRAIENHYRTMTLDDIKQMSVPAADNCVLFLWATAPKLQDALDVMQAWGFQYKTHAIWDKQKIGMGYWFRGRHELLLVGTKGKFSPPDESLRTDSIFAYPRGKHSAKPVEVYSMLEKMFTKTKRLEMFARGQRAGWVSWGNQV